MSLQSVLQSLHPLPSSARTTAITSFVISQPPAARAQFRDELDRNLATFRITSETYSLFLKLSGDIGWAADVLDNHNDTKILSTAVDIVESRWLLHPDEALSTFGGKEGLVTLIASSIPQTIALRIFRAFTKKRFAEDSVQTKTIDYLIQNSLPFLRQDSPTPLDRFATRIPASLFLSASSDMLRAVLPVCVAWMTNRTWKQLAKRYPTLVAELVLLQLDVPAAATWANNGRLKRPCVLKDTIPILIRSTDDSSEHWGVRFFRQFLRAYRKFLWSHPTLKSEDDILGIATGRVRSLNPLIKYYLSKQPNPLEAASLLIDDVEKTNRREGRVDWAFVDVDAIIQVAIDAFERTKAWTNPNLMSPTELPLLRQIARNLSPSELSLNFPVTKLKSYLEKLPTPARFPFLQLLYSTRMQISLTDRSVSPLSFPAIHGYLLSLLHPKDGRDLLEIGTALKGATFIRDPSTWEGGGSPRERGFFEFWKLNASVPEKNRPASIAAILQASWAGAERGPAGDRGVEIADRVRGDIDTFAKLASRSVEASQRLLFTQIAISLCVLSRSPRLFTKTLREAFERYAKDPETGPQLLDWISQNQLVTGFFAGPLGLYISTETARLLPREDILEWIEETEKALKAVTSVLNIWISEPNIIVGGAFSKWDDLMNMHYAILRARVLLLNKLYPKYILDLSEAQNLLLTPLADPILGLEDLRVIKYPTVLGFNAHDCVPVQRSPVEFHTRIFPAVISFVDGLSQRRENIYKEGRNQLGLTELQVEDDTLFSSGNRHVLPCPLSLENRLRRGPAHGLSLQGTGIESYEREVIFSPREGEVATAMLPDPLDCHVTQLDMALSNYLEFSGDDREMEQKVINILDHFGPKYGEDWRALVLNNDAVQERVWKSEVLIEELVKSWFPRIPPPDEQQDIQSLDPLSMMPPLVFKDRQGPRGRMMNRTVEMTKEDLYKILFNGFGKQTRFRFPGSQELRDRITVFATAWLMTLLGIPLAPDLPRGDTPITYAIRRVRLDTSFTETFPTSYAKNNYRLIYPFHLLKASATPPAELHILFTLLNTFPTNPSITLVSMHLLQLIRRSSTPGMVIGPSIQVLANSNLSSWARGTITSGLLASRRPRETKNICDMLVTLVEDAAKKQVDEQELFQDEEEDEAAPKKGLKVSTAKLVIQIARSTFNSGTIDLATALDIAKRVGAVFKHSSILDEVLRLLIDVAKEEAITRGKNQSQSEAWKLLQTYVRHATCLSEAQYISDMTWEEAKNGAENMPIIEDTHSLATIFFKVQDRELPGDLPNLWAQDVVTPVIIGQLHNRTRWLNTLVERESGSEDELAQIDASYDKIFDVPRLFTSFATSFIQSAGDPSQKPTNLLQALEHRIRTIFRREPFLSFIVKARKLSSEHEWPPVELEKLVELTRHATENDVTAFHTALSTIVTQRFKGKLPASSAAELDVVIRRLGESFLRPEDANVTAGTPWQPVVPFYTFTQYRQLLTPDLSGDKGEWYEILRPILIRMLELAENHEREEGSKALNGGASYWGPIVSLKLDLLPHPARAPFSKDANRHQKYAQALMDLTKQVLTYPSYHTHFSKIKDYFSPSAFRVEDALAVCDKLTSPPILPVGHGTLRVACFELAANLANRWSGEIKRDATRQGQMENIKKRWFEDEDGLVRYISLTVV